jgi:adenylate kinase
MTASVTVLVCGIAGVGKTFLISRVLEQFPSALAWRASEIIGEARKISDPEYLRQLPIDDLRQSQELLVKGYEGRQVMRTGRLVLLDAHAVIDAPSGFFDISTEVIRRLRPNAIVHIEDAVERIVERRKRDTKRPRPARTAVQLSLYQERSLQLCQTFADKLDVPLTRISSGDDTALSRLVASLV